MGDTRKDEASDKNKHRLLISISQVAERWLSPAQPCPSCGLSRLMSNFRFHGKVWDDLPLTKHQTKDSHPPPLYVSMQMCSKPMPTNVIMHSESSAATNAETFHPHNTSRSQAPVVSDRQNDKNGCASERAEQNSKGSSSQIKS